MIIRCKTKALSALSESHFYRLEVVISTQAKDKALGSGYTREQFLLKSSELARFS